MLHSSLRLKENKDFRRVYKKGRSLAYPYFILYHCRRGGKGFRIGFTVSKKVGKAVIRNKCKRRFREAARFFKNDFIAGRDYVFIVRQNAAGASFAEIAAQMQKALKKLEKD